MRRQGREKGKLVNRVPKQKSLRLSSHGDESDEDISITKPLTLQRSRSWILHFRSAVLTWCRC